MNEAVILSLTRVISSDPERVGKVAQAVVVVHQIIKRQLHGGRKILKAVILNPTLAAFNNLERVSAAAQTLTTLCQIMERWPRGERKIPVL